MESKPCHACGVETPLNEFAFNSRGERGRRCRVCRSNHQAGKAARRKERTLDDLEKAAIKVFTKGAATGGENVPHISELLERTMSLFGGSGGFASALVKQYFDAPPGSATRTKMLETITRLTTQASEMGASKKPLEFWTDDELEAELDKRIAQVLPFRIVEESAELQGLGGPSEEPEHHELPASAIGGAASGDLPEVDRGGEDVRPESGPGGDAPVHGE